MFSILLKYLLLANVCWCVLCCQVLGWPYLVTSTPQLTTRTIRDPCQGTRHPFTAFWAARRPRP